MIYVAQFWEPGASPSPIRGQDFEIPVYDAHEIPVHEDVGGTSDRTRWGEFESTREAEEDLHAEQSPSHSGRSRRSASVEETPAMARQRLESRFVRSPYTTIPTTATQHRESPPSTNVSIQLFCRKELQDHIDNKCKGSSSIVGQIGDMGPDEFRVGLPSPSNVVIRYGQKFFADLVLTGGWITDQVRRVLM